MPGFQYIACGKPVAVFFEQTVLGLFLGVAGKQHPRRSAGQEKNQRVGVRVSEKGFERSQHVDSELSGEKDVSGAGLPRRGPVSCRLGRERLRVGFARTGVGHIYSRGSVVSDYHIGAAYVVLVGVRDEKHPERFYSGGAKIVVQRLLRRVGPRVDKNVPAGAADQRRVPLADVYEMKLDSAGAPRSILARREIEDRGKNRGNNDESRPQRGFLLFRNPAFRICSVSAFGFIAGSAVLSPFISHFYRQFYLRKAFFEDIIA